MPPLTFDVRRSTGARELEPLEPVEQVAEDRLQLHPGEVRSDVEVLPEAEREGAGSASRSTRNVNGSPNTSSSRLPEAKKIAMLSPAGISTPWISLVLGGVAGEVDDRTHPAQDLLDPVGQEIGPGLQRSPLVGVLR